jgi:hypothetical protein
MNAIYDGGNRRYPRRLKEIKREVEDRSIYVGGTEIGFMRSNIPFLHTDTWKGTGMPLYPEEKAKAINKTMKKAIEELAKKNKDNK